MSFNPKAKPPVEDTDQYNVTLPVGLKTRLIKLRPRVDEAGYLFNETLAEVIAEFADNFDELLKSGKRGSSKAMPTPSSNGLRDNVSG